jgi:hypothetical protein
MRRNWLFMTVCILFGAVTIDADLASSVSAAPGASEIWLSAVPPFVRQKMFQEADSDYLDLFKPEAPWSRAALQARRSVHA